MGGAKIAKNCQNNKKLLYFYTYWEKTECMASMSVKPLTEIVKFMIFGMPRPVGSFFFFLDFDLKLFGLKKKRKQIPNKMVEKFFKLKKITAYENNLHYKEY